MQTFLEILNPSFLLFPAVMGSLILGLLCPVVGGFLVLRRGVLLGLTLPQVAAAGVACTFWLHQLGMIPNLGLTDPTHSVSDFHQIHRVLAYAGSLFFTLLGMALLGFFERRGRGRTETRLAVAYATAGSLTILFVVFNPFGDVAILSLVKGEVIVLSMTELTLLALLGTFILGFFVLFRRELLLCSFDRELLFLLKGRTLLWETLFFVLCGLTIALGVIMAGPLMVFGFLVLPPIAARPFVQRIFPYFLLSSILGVSVALLGFVVSYRLDLPLGPTDVALGCVVVMGAHALSLLVRKSLASLISGLLFLALSCSAPLKNSGPFPLNAASEKVSMWLAPVANRTGRSLLLPATNPVNALKDMLGRENSEERDTVMKLLRASMDLEVGRRGFAASKPELLDPRLSHFPSNVENAIEVARKANISGNLVLTEILRWSPERGFVSVLIVVTLIDLNRGEVSWQKRIQGALPTKSAVSLRDAHVDAVRAVIEKIFQPA